MERALPAETIQQPPEESHDLLVFRPKVVGSPVGVDRVFERGGFPCCSPHA
jgi:hypothetical protein